MENKVPVFVPIDPALTTAAPRPPAPPFNCTDSANGRATVCHGDLLVHLHALMRWGKMNEAKLEQIHGLQPEREAPGNSAGAGGTVPGGADPG